MIWSGIKLYIFVEWVHREVLIHVMFNSEKRILEPTIPLA